MGSGKSEPPPPETPKPIESVSGPKQWAITQERYTQPERDQARANDSLELLQQEQEDRSKNLLG